jgi:hypothetical protein
MPDPHRTAVFYEFHVAMVHCRISWVNERCGYRYEVGRNGGLVELLSQTRALTLRPALGVGAEERAATR